jgi:hypothetical protein
MRRAFALLLYLAMIGGGLVTLIWMLLLAHGGRGIVLLAGGTLFGFGLYLLWIDFIAPAEKDDVPGP